MNYRFWPRPKVCELFLRCDENGPHFHLDFKALCGETVQHSTAQHNHIVVVVSRGTVRSIYSVQ
jgi:hypothetical protein